MNGISLANHASCQDRLDNVNICFMDILDQLDAGVEKLLSRMAELENENSRLRNEKSELELEKSRLAEENHKLRTVVAHEENMRRQALERIDNLLCKIRDHDSIA